MEDVQPTIIRLSKPLHLALRQMLLAHGKTLSQWANEHAEADTEIYRHSSVPKRAQRSTTTTKSKT